MQDDALTLRLFQNYERAGREAKYWASYFLRELKNYGGLTTAKRILNKSDKNGITKGFIALEKVNLIELSVENVVLSPEFRHLFTPEEIAIAERRLGWRISRLYPDEVPSNRTYQEGAVASVLVNRYERDPAARKACLDTHGTRCKVCDLDFSERYGEIGKGFIHVHHVVSVSVAKKPHKVSPHADLVPVCPNCHAMLHKTVPPMTVESLKSQLRAAVRR